VIDIEASIRAQLVADAAVAALAGDRIEAATTPHRGYSVSDGPLVLFGVRGGQTDYARVLLMPSLQFRCYAATETLARALDRAVYDCLTHQGQRCNGIASADVESLGSLLHEPTTEWPFVLSFWKFRMFNTAP
jgi:hypothetical protein